jgi:Outer membrane protein Omp28
MSFIRLTMVCFAVLSLLTSCKEENPGIILTVPEKPLLDTTYTTASIPAAQDHDVLLFDITGVRCVNCPQAAQIARKIADTLHPGRVVVVAVYPEQPSPLWWAWAGFDTMSNSYSESLVQNIGAISTLPTGCVDLVSNAGSRFLDRNSWVTFVNNRLSVTTPLNISINTSWDNITNRGRLDAKVVYTNSVSNKHLIFIAVTESHIIGKQSDLKLGEILDYEHNHALRKLYTSTSGDTLKAALTPGRVFEKQFYINPRYNWKPKNLDAVVWVVDATTKEVVQVAHAKLQP